MSSRAKGFASDVAFSDAVKAVQTVRGSRASYERLEETRGGFATVITAELRAFIEERDSAYLATANAVGQPYVQHRGGPRGFIRVVDDHTLAFADFAGNRQYITTGNLSENDRAFIFLMDYEHQERIKLWGRARVITNDAKLFETLDVPGYRARVEQAIVFAVDAWNENCSQHIPRLVHSSNEDAASIEALQRRVDVLERALRAAGVDA